MKKLFTAYNEFHGTHASFYADANDIHTDAMGCKNIRIHVRTYGRLSKRLCGMADCGCCSVQYAKIGSASFDDDRQQLGIAFK